MAKGQPAVSLVGFANTDQYVSDVTYLDRRSSSWPYVNTGEARYKFISSASSVLLVHDSFRLLNRHRGNTYLTSVPLVSGNTYLTAALPLVSVRRMDVKLSESRVKISPRVQAPFYLCTTYVATNAFNELSDLKQG